MSHPIDLAELALTRATTTGDPRWHRAAVLLLRWAIEQALRRMWTLRAPSMEETSMRAQLLCMDPYIADQDFVGDIRHLWHRLSAMCHVSEVWTAPSARDLARHVPVVRELVGHKALG